MKTSVETAVKALIEKSKEAPVAVEALQFSQAALNLAHTLTVMSAPKNK